MSGASGTRRPEVLINRRHRPEHSGKARRLPGLGRTLAVSGVLLFFAQGAGRSADQNPDANSLVKRMISLYQNAQTLQETTESKIFQTNGQQFVQSSSLKYKRPNLLMFTLQDPNMGSMVYSSNGKTITVYSGKQNIFTKRTAPKNAPEIAGVLSRTSMELTGVGQDQMLSPLEFFGTRGMPKEAKTFRYVGTKSIEGHKTYQLNGQIDMDWLHNLMPDSRITPVRRDVVLLIDTQTNLLVRASLVATWKVEALGQGDSALLAAQRGFAFEETHRGTVLNAALRDQDFQFYPPKGAVEKFQDRR